MLLVIIIPFSCPLQYVRPCFLHLGLPPVAYVIIFLGLCQLVIYLLLLSHHTSLCYVHIPLMCFHLVDMIASLFKIHVGYIGYNFHQLGNSIFSGECSSSPTFFLIPFFLFSYLIITQSILLYFYFYYSLLTKDIFSG